MNDKKKIGEIKKIFDELEEGKLTPILEETFTENKPSFQMEDFLRKNFSNYKTPILLNEIFN